MHSSLSLLALLGLGAHAFPNMSPEFLETLAARIEARGYEAPKMPRAVTNPLLPLSADEGNCGPIPCLVFDAEEQYVSTSGQNAYAPPAPDEIRGPCPGLNAAANHAYLPRSGIPSISDTIVGLGQAYGMSVDLAGFLAAYAVIMDGDLLTQTWSIGGPPPADTLGGLLGQPEGISYSHNNYEGDTSIGRNDAYINHGDAYSLNVTRFAWAYATGMDDDRYTLDKFRKDVQHNQEWSIQHNPYYFAAPFSTTLVVPAAYNFVINFMSNHTAEEPNGYLNGEMFKQFFAVEGDYPNFTWLPGQERIPDNWYRRTSTNQYNAVNVIQDLGIGFAAYPNTFRLGGNTNGVNTYAGVDPSLLTGGAYNFETLLEGDNLGCFLFQTQQAAVPDFLKGGLNDLATAVSFITPYFSTILDKFTCPALAIYDDSVFNSFPGYFYSPTAPNNNGGK